jgi:CRP/FNR family transcriptional regulator, cyclic AMP receptor protein
MMLDLLHRQPEFAARFLTYLLSRHIRRESDLVDHLFNSSQKRLARLLLLAHFGQESKPTPMIAKISQETLAEMIGTTRSRVSLFLYRFRELGMFTASLSASWSTTEVSTKALAAHGGGRKCINSCFD